MIRWLLGFLLLCWPALADIQPDPKPITWTKCSGTTTGSAQKLSLGSGPLRGFFLQNPLRASGNLYLDPNGTATSTSIELQPGGLPVTFGPGTIFAGNSPTVYNATANQPFICYYGQ